MTGPPPQPLGERLAKYIIPSPGCWEWTGFKGPKGYGRVRVGSHLDGSRRFVAAHRAVYELLAGPIPDGLTLDHLCRNHSCVNPDHLEPVTRGENTLRGDTITARSAAKTHCDHGHEFTPENTYTPPSRAVRMCRECRRRLDRESYYRQKAGK